MVLLCQTGCITTAVILGGAAVFGAAGSDEKNVSMNYETDIGKCFETTKTQMTQMGFPPEPKKTDAKGSQRELESGDVYVVLKEMKKGVGTTVSVRADAKKQDEVDRARKLLNAVAKELGQYGEALRDYKSPIKETWDAAIAELKAMEREPSQHGTELKGDSGRIRLDEAWVDLESLADGTRIRIDFATGDTDKGIAECEKFLDGVAKRLGEAEPAPE
jgi:hypothetical protein